MPAHQPPLTQLQSDWKTIFQQTLPQAAQSKSPSQPIWSVHVDHCFARIILDNEIGITKPWMAVLKSPAYKNMTPEQLEKCIELGRKILDGEVDLVELDEKSLGLRGKASRKRKVGGDGGKEEGEGKRRKVNSPAKKDVKKRAAGDDDSKLEKSSAEEKKDKVPSPAPSKEDSKSSSPRSAEQELDSEPETESKTKKNKADPSETAEPSKKSSPTSSTPQKEIEKDLKPYLSKIALSQKTPFQKKVLSALCQVPRGQYTTYGSIATHLSSSARAVGSAIRNNPFAPHVPCHRVLATGGGLGGFGGSWGRKGEAGLNDDKKRKLLREEGVRFDGKGRVVGRVWEGFV
ncbi:hypothetical protein VTL71DRAFT_15187 [Oculimacula yallundae]|uniref:Methylated-DNA--protein-cysteine methyltransferase n=1 Tax=Oculimacula yallundae TaxID=86028 RepID=A0ABR4CGH3_9HELO